MDQPKLERLLRLMKMLTANTGYTVHDLAERLDISIRTVYRYIDTFKEAGFVVKKSGDYIRLDKSSPYFKDISELVHFTEEEAYILKSAIEAIDENNLIKQNLKKKLYSVYDYKILADTVVKGRVARSVHKIIEAIENKQQVLFRQYSSSHSDEVSDRIVEPFAFTTNYIQVWAYEVSSGENKLYKVSRIGSVEEVSLSSPWEYESEHKHHPIDIFRFSNFKQYPIELKLSLRAASLLCEEYPLAEQQLERLEDENDCNDGKGNNAWLLRTNVGSFEGPCRFVLGLYKDIEVLGSPEFRDFVKARIAEMQ